MLNIFSKSQAYKAVLVNLAVIVCVLLLHPEIMRFGPSDMMFLSVAAPYGFYLILSLLMGNLGVAIGGGLVLLLLDVVSTIIIAKFSSILTSGGGIALSMLFFSGIGRIVIILPLGAFTGWYIGRKFIQPEESSETAVLPEEKGSLGPELPVKILAWAGMLFHILLQFQGSWSPLGLIFVAWGALPYVICYFLNRKVANKWAMLFCVAAALGFDVKASVAMLFFPTSSTSSVGMIFLPTKLIFNIMPIGFAAGWLFSWLVRFFNKIPMSDNMRQRSLKIGYVLLGVAAVAVLLNYGRIAKGLRKTVDRNAEIGEPRIVLGTDTFKKTPIPGVQGWAQAGVYDVKQGLEIADITSKQINFMDPRTYEIKRTTENSHSFSWMENLVSINGDGQLNILSSGGGYSKVGLFDMNGKQLWGFQPDKQLPPNKLIAADLDENGEKEFYATDHTGFYRLDAKGNVVWKSSANYGGYYIGVIPAHKDVPALVISDTPQGKISMWDKDGNLYKEIKPAVSPYMLQVVRWGEDYCLAAGQTSSEGSGVFLMDLDGNIRFKQRIGDGFGVNGIMSVRFEPAKEPYLVVIGGGGGGVHLTELNIFTYFGKLVYKELRESYQLQVIPDDLNKIDALVGGNPFSKYEKI